MIPAPGQTPAPAAPGQLDVCQFGDKISISGVNFLGVSEETLSAVLQQFGTHHFIVFQRPHCIVEFEDEESASNAVARLHGAAPSWNNNGDFGTALPEPEIDMRVTVVKFHRVGNFTYSTQHGKSATITDTNWKGLHLIKVKMDSDGQIKVFKRNELKPEHHDHTFIDIQPPSVDCQLLAGDFVQIVKKNEDGSNSGTHGQPAHVCEINWLNRGLIKVEMENGTTKSFLPVELQRIPPPSNWRSNIDEQLALQLHAMELERAGDHTLARSLYGASE